MPDVSESAPRREAPMRGTPDLMALAAITDAVEALLGEAMRDGERRFRRRNAACDRGQQQQRQDMKPHRAADTSKCHGLLAALPRSAKV